MPKTPSTDKKISADALKKANEFSSTFEGFQVIETRIKKLLETRKPLDTATEESYYKDIFEKCLVFSKHPEYAEQITKHVASVSALIHTYQQTKPHNREHNLYCNLMSIRNNDRWLTAIKGNDKITTNEWTDPFTIYYLQQKCYIELSIEYAKKQQFKISKQFYEKSNFYKKLYYKNEKDLTQKINWKIANAHHIGILAEDFRSFEIEFSIELAQLAFKNLTKLSNGANKDFQAPIATILKKIQELLETLQKQKIKLAQNKKIDEEFLHLEQHISELLYKRKSDLETEEKLFDEFFKRHESELETKDFINKLIQHTQKMSTIKMSFLQSRNTSIQKTELIYLNEMLIRSQTRLLNFLRTSKVYKDTSSSKKIQVTVLLLLFVSHMENCSAHEVLQQFDIAQQHYKKAIEYKVELDRIPTLSTAERQSVLYQYAQTHCAYAKVSYTVDPRRAEIYLNISNVGLQELIRQSVIEPPLTKEIISSLQNRIQSLQATFQQKKLEADALELAIRNKKIDEGFSHLEQHVGDLLHNRKSDLETEEKLFDEFFKNHEHYLENGDFLNKFIQHTQRITDIKFTFLRGNSLAPPTTIIYINEIVIRSQIRLLTVFNQSTVCKNMSNLFENECNSFLGLFYCQTEISLAYVKLKQPALAQQHYQKAMEYKTKLDTMLINSPLHRQLLKFKCAQYHCRYAAVCYSTELESAETYLKISTDNLQEVIEQPILENPFVKAEQIADLQKNIHFTQTLIEQKKLEIDALRLQEEARLAQVELKRIEEKRKLEEQQRLEEQQKQLEAQKKAFDEKQLKDKEYALRNQAGALANAARFTKTLTLYNEPNQPSNPLLPLAPVAQQNPPLLLLTKMNAAQNMSCVSIFSKFQFDNLSSDFQQAIRTQKPLEITAAGMKLLEYSEFHTIMIQPYSSIKQIHQGITLFEHSYFHLQGILDTVNANFLQGINLPIFLQRLNTISVSLYQKRENAIEILTQSHQHLTQQMQLTTSEIELKTTLSWAISALNTMTDRHLRQPLLLR